MNFSLLYKNPEPASAFGAVKPLLLDETLSAICGDNSKAERFANVIAAPCTDPENINYRREIIADLRANEKLAARLKTVFGRYDRMKNDWLGMRDGAAAPSDASAEVRLDAAWSALKRISTFPAALVSFISEIRDAIPPDEVKSQGLRALRDRCAALVDGQLAALAATADKFRFSAPETHSLELSVRTDAAFACVSVSVADVVETPPKKRGLSAVFKRKQRDENSTEDGSAAQFEMSLEVRALTELGGVMTDVLDAVYDTFYGISEEISFYECALEFVAFLERHSLCCFPDIAENGAGECRISSLHDLRLLTGGAAVVPYDLDIPPQTRGLLIRGENGAGKTTFLRALGTAILLCQAGLPIPARGAEMPILNGVYAHFASSEEDFRTGDRAGRFESEVRALSDILDGIGAGAILLMNETFQSTTFDEGTRAMRDLLCALGDNGVAYVLVTHLTSLFDEPIEGTERFEFDLNNHTYKKLEVKQ